MNDEKITINRSLVGILALLCLGAAIAIWLANPDSQNGRLWLAGFVRVGLVMCAFWLALPSRHREAAWANVSPTILIGMVAAILVAALRPKMARVVIPILFLLAVLSVVLRPREKQRPTSRPKGSS